MKTLLLLLLFCICIFADDGCTSCSGGDGDPHDGGIETISVKGASTGIATEFSFRDGEFTMVLDEPAAWGGENRGPNPIEANLASLIGCENAVVRMVWAQNELTVGKMDWSASGVLTIENFMKGERAYYDKVTLELTMETDATVEQMEELKDACQRMCPLGSLLHHVPDLEFEVDWKIVPMPVGDEL